MALVARGNGSGFFLDVTLSDTQGDLSSKRYELTAVDFATAQADALTIRGALEGMTDSVIQSYRISQVFDEDAFAFPTGADNGVRARLTYQLADSVDKATEDIPAPAQAIFVSPAGPNNNVIDTLATEVVTYVQIYQAGGQAFISDGERTDFLLRGKRTTR